MNRVGYAKPEGFVRGKTRVPRRNFPLNNFDYWSNLCACWSLKESLLFSSIKIVTRRSSSSLVKNLHISRVELQRILFEASVLIFLFSFPPLFPLLLLLLLFSWLLSSTNAREVLVELQKNLACDLPISLFWNQI